jgi:hypothetical protein
VTTSRRSVLLGLAGIFVIPRRTLAQERCDVDSPDFKMGNIPCEISVDIPADVKTSAQQQKENWCWAACIHMIFACSNYQVSQNRLVHSVLPLSDDNRPVLGQQVKSAIDGYWVDDNDKPFSAYCNVFIDLNRHFVRPDAIQRAAESLADGDLCIVGSEGHATVLTKIVDAGGGVAHRSLWVWDPWPTIGGLPFEAVNNFARGPREVPWLGHGGPNKNFEAANTNFVAAVEVQRPRSRQEEAKFREKAKTWTERSK